MNSLENRSDTSFDPPDRSTQMPLLAVQGEQQTIEYKRQLPTTPAERRNLARTVVGFANSQGGWLIYGLDRDSSSGTRVVGVQSTPNLADDIVRTIRDSVTPDPGIEIVQAEVEGKGLVAVVVPARRKRFFALNTTPPQFFIRRQANTFPATLSEIRELAETLADQPAGAYRPPLMS